MTLTNSTVSGNSAYGIIGGILNRGTVTLNRSLISGNSATGGQVSCWPARGDADDVWDSNPGTLQNGATFAAGLVGQAFSFDGTNDFVLVPDANNLDVTTDFTINAWLYQDVQQSGLGTVVGKGRAPAGTGFAMSISNGHAGIGLNNGPNCVASDSQTLPLGQWNHVAVTFDSSTVKVYVNGQLRATQSCSFSSILVSTEPLNIGRETSGLGRYYAGLADQVQIHDRALTLAEIQAIYAGGQLAMMRWIENSSLDASAELSSIFNPLSSAWSVVACPERSRRVEGVVGLLNVNRKGKFTCIGTESGSM